MDAPHACPAILRQRERPCRPESPPSGGPRAAAWRRLGPAALLLLCCVLCPLMPPATAMAAPSPFPRLQAGQVYSTAQKEPGLDYTARLRLLDRHFFELSETIVMRGEPELRRKSTGRWLQIRQGGMLLLHNHYGMSRLLSLGRSQTLYADMPLKGDAPSLGVRFCLDSPDGAPVRVMGVLLLRNGVPLLREGGSGLDFALQESPRLRQLLHGPLPLFVEADCRFRPDALEIVGVQASSSRLPGSAAATEPDLHALTDGGGWIMDLDDGTQLGCTFSRASATTGSMIVTASGLFLQVPYTVHGAELRFALKTEDREMLRALGMTALASLLDKTRRWSLHGSVLVLENMQDLLGILEGNER